MDHARYLPIVLLEGDFRFHVALKRLHGFLIDIDRRRGWLRAFGHAIGVSAQEAKPIEECQAKHQHDVIDSREISSGQLLPVTWPTLTAFAVMRR